MNDLVKNLLLWALVAVVLMLVFNSFNPGQGATGEVRYSQFMEQVRRDQIKSVKIAEDEKTVEFVTKGGETGTVIAPRRDQRCIKLPYCRGIPETETRANRPAVWQATIVPTCRRARSQGREAGGRAP